MKKSQLRLIWALFLCVSGSAWALEDSDIEFKRVSIAGQFDNGQIVSGKTNHFDLESDYDLGGEFFQRTGVWITQEAVVKGRLHLIMGVGGIFWYSLPIKPNNINTRQTQFGPGISQAQGIYAFGEDPSKPVASLQMGLFPYKYNPDAKNLGEYLMRSGTYPGYLITGGWNMLSSAAYMTQGFRLNVPLWDGKFQSDLIFAMERDIPPLFAISPAYVATVTPINGLQFGAGAACNHCIPVKPSRETPHVPENQVITGVTATYDSSLQAYSYVYARDTNSYYTFQGIKVMASASIDPKAFIPMPFLGAEDLKLYSEIAVLGWKNYPFLYEKRSERMPIMVGFNVPTFKLLDVLSIEGEYYNSQFTNNYTNQVYGSVPMWWLPGADGALVEGKWVDDDASNIRRDNWKWSVYAKKEVTKGIRVYAQAASDHIRTISSNFGPFPATVPITNRNGKDWYYIIRLDFGI